ncbi:hypothetical protein N9W89_07150 [Hellea sp.]|nr:hypothetical protein [Hellea sp.]
MPLTLNDITTVDADARTVTHIASGLVIGWPETPPGKFSTLFRLVFQGNGLEFQLRWELKQSAGGETLICQPEINDGAERAPKGDPINILVKEVYACLWAYAEHVQSGDKARAFAMVYNDNIYTGDVRIPMKDT